MLENIIYVGGIGCVLFTAWLILFALSGLVKHLRNEAGEFRKKWSWQGILAMSVFVTFLLSILVWGNFRLEACIKADTTLVQLFLNSFGIFMVIHLYDLIIIDYLIIVKWHPNFLKLPDTVYYNSLKPHLKGFIRGIPIGIVASILAAFLYTQVGR